MKQEDAVRMTYAAYNARDLARAREALAPDVQWDDGSGSMIKGKNAVAKHWTEQWRKADAKVQIEKLSRHGSTFHLVVSIDVRVSRESRAKQKVNNIIEFDGSLIRLMRIE
jgi:ketosteroid isomerase-like protein